MKSRLLSTKVGLAHAREATGAVWFMTQKGSRTVRREVPASEAVASIASGAMRVRVRLEDSLHTATMKLPGGDVFGYELSFDYRP